MLSVRICFQFSSFIHKHHPLKTLAYFSDSSNTDVIPSQYRFPSWNYMSQNLYKIPVLSLFFTIFTLCKKQNIISNVNC